MTGRSTTRSPFDPSRFVFEETSKRPSKAVHFISGEASFSEHAPPIIPTTKPRRRNVERRASILSANVLTLVAVLGLIIGLTYSPFALPGVSSLATIFADARQRMLVAVSLPATLPASACTVSPDTLRQIAEEAAALVRGVVLRPDYALSANGGKIYPTLTSPLPERFRQRSPPQSPDLAPNVVLDEQTIVGRCWTTSIGGQVGFSTGVLLYPSHVTVEHIARQIAVDIERAPRHMILWGVVDGLPNIHRFRRLIDAHDTQFPANSPFEGRFAPRISATHAFVALAAFEYDIQADTSVQTFAVFDRVVESKMDFGIFVLEVVDNWGGADTCIYRVQVHGVPAPVNARESGE